MRPEKPLRGSSLFTAFGHMPDLLNNFRSCLLFICKSITLYIRFKKVDADIDADAETAMLSNADVDDDADANMSISA